MNANKKGAAPSPLCSQAPPAVCLSFPVDRGQCFHDALGMITNLNPVQAAEPESPSTPIAIVELELLHFQK